MAQSNRPYSAIPVGIALAAAVILGSCGGGGEEDLSAVAVYVKASNTGTLDQFGGSIALAGDGNTLAIGARFEDSGLLGVTAGVVSELTAGNAAADSGAVYVLIRNGTVWGQQAYVKPVNVGTSAAGDSFGSSLALSGDGNTLAVGAPLEDSGTTGINSTADELAPGAGAVYVLTRSGGIWSHQAYVKPLNTGTSGAGDNFGVSVALSNDGSTLAVGAPLEDSNTTGFNTPPNEFATDSGAVYVFTRDAMGTWLQQAYVKASDTAGGDNFGFTVALSADGNTLAVGAPLEDSGTAADAGAVYVFTRAAGVWTEQQYIKAAFPGAGDRFGTSVSLSADGNTLAVGAPSEDSAALGVGGNQIDDCGAAAPANCASDSGAAYVFARSGSVWSQQVYLKASNTGPGDNFGSSVALSGDGNALMVGAINEDGSATGTGGTSNELATDSGAVYAYTRSGTVWTPQSYVKASNTGAGDGFGVSVALSSDGSTRAIGAQFEDGNATGIGGNQGNNSVPDAGAVYIYQ